MDARNEMPGLTTEYGVKPSPAARRIEEFNLREMLHRVLRQKWLVLSTIVAVMAVTTVALFLITPRYSAESLIRIEPQNTNVGDLKSVIAGLPSDDQTVDSEMEVIQSRDLVKKLVRRLELDQDPEFNEELRPKGFIATHLDPRNWLPDSWRGKLSAGNDFDALPDDVKQAIIESRVVDAVLEGLDVSVKGRSRILSLVATSENPGLAPVIANTLANLYIDNQLDITLAATKRASSGLNEQIASLRKAVDESEQAVESYRRKAGLISADSGVTLTARQLSELNTRLIVARADMEAKAAKLAQVRKLIQDGKIDSLPEVLQSPLIQKLREQEAEVQRKIAELSSEYGPLHPTMVNARAEAQDLESKIKVEIDKIVGGMQNEVDSAKANVNALERSVDDLESKVAASNTTSIKLRALEREATANRSLLETFLTRVKETNAQEDVDIQQPLARIVSLADIPEKPSSPKMGLALTLAFIGSIFLGLLLVFVAEQLDTGFRSGEEVENETGLLVLGLVPKIENGAGGIRARFGEFMGTLARTRIAQTLGLASFLRKYSQPQDDPVSYIVEKPLSSFSEAVRGFHTSIMLSSGGHLPKKILITSAQPNEGKTTLAVCLARTLAGSDHKVILVEADLRLSVVGDTLKLANEPGLSEFLSGASSLEDILKKDEGSGADVITAGKVTPNPLDLLASERMTDLLDELAEEYDFVVVDSPPVMAVSDARVLSVMADLTVFAVRWASTSRKIVNAALKQLTMSGSNLGGIVLTLVDARKHARYDYGDSGYYLDPIKKYYVN